MFLLLLLFFVSGYATKIVDLIILKLVSEFHILPIIILKVIALFETTTTTTTPQKSEYHCLLSKESNPMIS